MVLHNLLSQAEEINQEQLLSDYSWLTPPLHNRHKSESLLIC